MSVSRGAAPAVTDGRLALMWQRLRSILLLLEFVTVGGLVAYGMIAGLWSAIIGP